MIKDIFDIKPSEKQIQQMVIDWLNLHHLTKDKFHSIPNEGKRSVKTGRVMRSMGLKKGVSDIFLMIPTSQFHGMYLEIKRDKKSKISPEQLEFKKMALNQGYYACIAIGYDQCIEEINNYLKTI